MPWSDQDTMRLELLLCSTVDKTVKPPPQIKWKTLSMLDSRSEPTVADCAKEFPRHLIRESDGQRKGLQYKGANGALIPNLGETTLKHR